MTDSKPEIAARWVLALGMIAIGITHFTNPDPFLKIMPAALPWHLGLVYVSGAFEIALGGLLLLERTRKLAGLGLVALYLAVFPANIYMAVNEIQLNPESPMPTWVAWARLPLQFVLIAWALWVGGAPPARSRRADA